MSAAGPASAPIRASGTGAALPLPFAGEVVGSVRTQPPGEYRYSETGRVSPPPDSRRPQADENRRCAVCGSPLAGHRSDARVCSGACRAALSRQKRDRPDRRFWTGYAAVRRRRHAQRRTRGAAATRRYPSTSERKEVIG
jgi:predicted nucleic acid-binding Zn ribbon protein